MLPANYFLPDVLTPCGVLYEEPLDDAREALFYCLILKSQSPVLMQMFIRDPGDTLLTLGQCSLAFGSVTVRVRDAMQGAEDSVLLAVGLDQFGNVSVLRQWHVSGHDVGRSIEVDGPALVNDEGGVGRPRDVRGDVDQHAFRRHPHCVMLSVQVPIGPPVESPAENHAAARLSDFGLDVPVAVAVWEKAISQGHDDWLAATACEFHQLFESRVIKGCRSVVWMNWARQLFLPKCEGEIDTTVPATAAPPSAAAWAGFLTNELPHHLLAMTDPYEDDRGLSSREWKHLEIKPSHEAAGATATH